MIEKTPDPSHKTQDLAFAKATADQHRVSSIEYRASRPGFSLTEVLIAIGVLAVGMLFIAGAFPVSIHFTTVATERTIAPIVADEAFAKYRIYSKYLDISTLKSDTHEILIGGTPNDYAYPSTSSTEPYTKKYWWSAIFRRITPTSNDIQVTVFVSRKAGATSQYDVINSPDFDPSRPDVVAVQLSGTTGGYELTFIDPSLRTYINDGYTIVDDVTGQIYRVLERYPGNDTVIKIDRPWRPDLTPSQVATDYVWIISPPAAGGRYPCIGVYQKVM